MPGILDLDPQTQGLLQAAFAGLQASGPSRMPVSTGQVLGQAGSAGIAGYDQAQKLRSALALQDMQTKLTGAHLQQLQQELEIQRGLMSGGGFGDMMSDPAKLRAVGLITKRPEFLTHAERIEKQQAEDLQLKSYRPVSQTIQPDPQEAAQSADLGTPAVPPATVQTGGIFGALKASPIRQIASEARGYEQALMSQPNARGLPPEHWMNIAKHLSDQERLALNREENRGLREDLPGIIAGYRNPQILQSDQGIFAYKDGKAEPILDPNGQPLKPTATARIDISTANQLQRQFNAATRPSIDALGSTGIYRNARETGDTAQAAMIAAEALRRSARGSNQRFSADVGRILGSGYGSGSIADRLENFISNELKGAPSDTTLKKLDNLIGATEQANLEQIARWNKHYSGQAKAHGIPVKSVIGEPTVEGRTVVFPEGEVVRFKTPAEATAKAQQWSDAN